MKFSQLCVAILVMFSGACAWGGEKEEKSGATKLLERLNREAEAQKQNPEYQRTLQQLKMVKNIQRLHNQETENLQELLAFCSAVDCIPEDISLTAEQLEAMAKKMKEHKKQKGAWQKELQKLFDSTKPKMVDAETQTESISTKEIETQTDPEPSTAQQIFEKSIQLKSTAIIAQMIEEARPELRQEFLRAAEKENSVQELQGSGVSPEFAEKKAPQLVEFSKKIATLREKDEENTHTLMQQKIEQLEKPKPSSARTTKAQRLQQQFRVSSELAPTPKDLTFVETPEFKKALEKTTGKSGGTLERVSKDEAEKIIEQVMAEREMRYEAGRQKLIHAMQQQSNGHGLPRFRRVMDYATVTGLMAQFGQNPASFMPIVEQTASVKVGDSSITGKNATKNRRKREKEKEKKGQSNNQTSPELKPTLKKSDAPQSDKKSVTFAGVLPENLEEAN